MTEYQALQSADHKWRLRVYPAALLAALLGAVLLATILYEEGDPESRLGGDYPAFYGAASIAASGDWDELYSDERQQAEQAGLIDDQGGYLYFSYPPFVAGAYSWLGTLDYRWSFLIHTVLMGIALVGAIRLLWPWLEGIGWPFVAIVALAVAFYPLMRAIPGGQNTSLSLLLVAAAARWDHDGKSLQSGVVLALLLFKPQFGIVLLPLMLVARRWRMLAGWAGGAAVLFAVSTVLMGGAWISGWWEQATAFSETNLAANGSNFISAPGFLENLAGAGSIGAFVVAYGLAAVAGLGVAYFWWRYPTSHSLERFALVAALVVVAAPQTLYYDAGLLLLGLVALRPWQSWRPLVWLPVLIAITWLQPLAAGVGWAPLGPISWLAMAAIGWKLLRQVEPTPV